MATTYGLRGFSRGLRVLATMGALAVIGGWSAAAHAKKENKLKMDPTAPETAEPAGPVPPEADADGHVNYGNPQAEGLGRVTVKSISGDKIQVYLEGRYFGDAPITIYSVPKGDYIVEGTFVWSGKQVSQPVSVSENEEATVELAGEEARHARGRRRWRRAAASCSGEISPAAPAASRRFVSSRAWPSWLVAASSSASSRTAKRATTRSHRPAQPGVPRLILEAGKRYAAAGHLGLFARGRAPSSAPPSPATRCSRSPTTGEKPPEPVDDDLLRGAHDRQRHDRRRALYRFWDPRQRSGAACAARAACACAATCRASRCR